MKVLIKTPNIPERLGYNFVVYTDKSPANQFFINRDEFLTGKVIEAENDSRILVVVALDVNIQPFQFTINKDNTITSSLLNAPLSEFRPKNENDEIIPFSEEEFPEYKIEEIRESIVGDSVFIDYLNKSHDYWIEVSSDQDEEDLSSIKIGVNRANNSIYFIYRKFQDNTEILEIYDEIGLYQVSKENINSPFILKEWANSDYIHGESLS